MTRIHGGTDSAGPAHYDFSTNSNACGPCPAALAAVSQADATRYPDSAYTALRGQLADFHSVPASRVLLAGSASEFIFRITAHAAQQGIHGVQLPRHSYGDYAQAALAQALVFDSQASPLLRWACDPSSPLGQAHEGLAGFAEAGFQDLCVLDRAYEPLRLQGSLQLTSQQLQNVWQLWTPNKALGLTGVRAAYVIAPVDADETSQALEQLCPSWPVGSHGVAMLSAWTSAEAQAWLAASLEWLRDWKIQQVALCESLGWTCLPSEANFFCARPRLPQGMTLQQVLGQLRAQGIQLRDGTSFGLPGHVRLSVQAPEAQGALHNAWLQIMKKA